MELLTHFRPFSLRSTTENTTRRTANDKASVIHIRPLRQLPIAPPAAQPLFRENAPQPLRAGREETEAV